MTVNSQIYLSFTCGLNCGKLQIGPAMNESHATCCTAKHQPSVKNSIVQITTSHHLRHVFVSHFHYYNSKGSIVAKFRILYKSTRNGKQLNETDGRTVSITRTWFGCSLYCQRLRFRQVLHGVNGDAKAGNGPHLCVCFLFVIINMMFKFSQTQMQSLRVNKPLKVKKSNVNSRC